MIFLQSYSMVLRKGQGRGSCICLKARGARADEFLKAWLSVIPIPHVRSQAIQNMYWGGWCCCTFTLFDVQPPWVFNTELALHIYLLSHVRHEEFFINYRGGRRRGWRASASYNSVFHWFNVFFVLFYMLWACNRMLWFESGMCHKVLWLINWSPALSHVLGGCRVFGM